MNKNFPGFTPLAAGGIIILLTAVTYWLAYMNADMTAVDKASLVFLLIAEFAATVGCYITLSKSLPGSPIILKSGIPAVLLLYFLATLLCALCKGLFDDRHILYIIVNLFFIAPTGIAVVFLASFAGRVYAADSATQAAMQFMLATERRLNSLKANEAAAAYAGPLNEIYELARYSDRVGSSSKDAEIFAEVELLEKLLAQTAPANDVEAAISKLKFLFNQRSCELSLSKRGEF